MNIGQSDFGDCLVYETRLGKFEGNRSERVSEMLYSLVLDNLLDDECGGVGEFGVFFGRVNSMKHKGGWIIGVNDYGFFTYSFYPHDRADKFEADWAEIGKEITALINSMETLEEWTDEHMEHMEA